MRFLHPDHDSILELSLDDVFIVPSYFSGKSRRDVNLKPIDGIGGSQPIVSANMNAVTGKRMAETMARYGGMGVLPQDMSLETVERIVRNIRNADIKYDTVLSVPANATVRDVDGIIKKRAHNLVVVCDYENKPIGVVTQANLRDRDQYLPIHLTMSQTIITVQDGISNEEAFNLMERERLHAVPVVNNEGKLIGVLTKEDSVRLDLLTPALDKNFNLMVGAAVGVNTDVQDLAVDLKDMGVSCIVIDTAHGHQEKMINAIKKARTALGKDFPIVAGNVCTEQGAIDLAEAGASIVKVNVGPGAMCTTRMQTGVGRPSFTSVQKCADALKKIGAYVWADGGVRHPRDVALYLAAGASRVMIGNMLAGTYESPGDLKSDSQGRMYKENWGMASARAVVDRNTNQSPFERAKRAFFREGISHSSVYLQKGRESVGDIIVEIVTGLQSTLTYTGVTNLSDFSNNVVVGVQTSAGFIEGTPHGLTKK